jgi:Zn-dependent peptidase ImmA (M78 family)
VVKKNNIELKKKYAILAIKWCREYFWLNERKETKLLFNFSTKSRKIGNSMVYGNYCFYRNKMTIYEPACETLYDVVATVIHEYTHYLQVRRKYREYEITRYYSQNPMEREAKRNEIKYAKECMKYVKSLM